MLASFPWFEVALPLLCSVLATALGALLLFVLLNLRFQKVREFTVWKLRRVLDPDKLEEGTFWHELVTDILFWLKREEKPASTRREHHQVRSKSDKPLPKLRYELGELLASNRCYETHLSRDKKLVLKFPMDGLGQKILAKEASVVGFLRQKANAGIYLRYLPTPKLSLRDVREERQPWAYESEAGRWTSAAELLASHRRLSQRDAGWVFSRLLQVLGFSHEHKTIHAGVMPQHMLLDLERHELKLVDWTHAKQLGERIQYLPNRYAPWYPTNETSLLAQAGLDVAMAARCVIALVEGVAPGFSHLQVKSQNWPKQIERFWIRCLNAQVTVDAWELHEEFIKLLETHYGPPTSLELQPV